MEAVSADHGATVAAEWCSRYIVAPPYRRFDLVPTTIKQPAPSPVGIGSPLAPPHFELVSVKARDDYTTMVLRAFKLYTG